MFHTQMIEDLNNMNPQQTMNHRAIKVVIITIITIIIIIQTMVQIIVVGNDLVR